MTVSTEGGSIEPPQQKQSQVGSETTFIAFHAPAHRTQKSSLTLLWSDGFLPEQTHLRMRFRFGFHLGLGLLIRALLAANPGKRLPQIGFDATGVTERAVEY
ncbi:MAG: hypothetical protein E6H71_14725 [Betaproteobacteria bacterium]|nr:MAG: hypothetical protein E6H71_14725 [Betaproteobacteria bacterium]